MDAQLACVWGSSPHDRCFHAVYATPASTIATPEVTEDQVRRELGERAFVVVSEGDADSRLMDLFNTSDSAHQEATKAAQRALILAASSDGQPLALFFVAMPPKQQIRYSYVERAARVLGQLGSHLSTMPKSKQVRTAADSQ